MKLRVTVLAAAAFLLGASAAPARAAVCVDASMLPGVGDGTCWGAPFARVQEGIDAAAAAGGGEVWVREGTYYENVSIPNGVAVYGGFAGGELALEERDPARHVTVLDGGLLRNTVVISGGPTTRVDGFTIQRGSATASSGPGGCVYAGGAPVVANNVIRQGSVVGWGGGMYVAAEGYGGTPLITGNLIYGNVASSGGAVFAVMGSPRIIGNVILQNRPGGMFVWATSAVIANNVVLDNSGGSGLFLASGRSARVVNNAFGRNGYGVQIDLDFSSVIANNSFFSNGAALWSSYTVVSDPGAVVNNAFHANGQLANANVTLGGGNLQQSCLPNSVSLTGGFHLTPGSPCVDAGLASALPPDLFTDRDGEARVAGAAPDIGPDELSYPLTLLTATGTGGRYPWFKSAVQISLSASGAPGGPAIDRTEYLQDGGAGWLPYAGPLSFDAQGAITRLSYRSVDAGGAAELPKETLLGVDSAAPTVAASASPPGTSGWYTSPATVTLAGADPAPGSGLDRFDYWTSCSYQRQPYRGPVTFDCDGGPSFLYWEAEDRAGNVTAGNLPLQVDVYPPTTYVYLDRYGSGGWVDSSVQATVSAGNAGSGVALTEYSIDGATWLQYLAPVAISAEGVTGFLSRAWDGLGRAGAALRTDVRIDLTPPVTTATLSGTGTGDWFRSDVVVTPSATDALSGVASTRYSLDGGATWTYLYYGAGFGVSAEGITGVTLSAADVAGNVETGNQLAVRIDRTPPATAARLAGTGGLDGSYVSPVTVTLDAADALSGVAATTYSLDGGPARAYAGPFTVAADGPHEVSFSSTDVAGNAEAAPPPVAFRIDATPPTCAIATSGVPGAAGWYRSPVVVTVASGDPLARLEYGLNGGAWTAYSAPFTLGTEAVWAVGCRAVDPAGNAGSSQATVAVDLACPVTVATLAGTPGLGGWFTSGVTVSLAGTDAVSGVASTEYSLDGLLWLAYAGPFTVADTATVLYRSTDLAGCAEDPPGATGVRIDVTRPARAGSSPQPGARGVSRTPVITVTYTEGVWAGGAFGAVDLTYVRGGRTYSVPLQRSVSGSVVTLQPTVSLRASTVHTVVLPAGAVRDVAGLESAADAFTFETR